jgi:hypothetical protein
MTDESPPAEPAVSASGPAQESGRVGDERFDVGGSSQPTAPLVVSSDPPPSVSDNEWAIQNHVASEGTDGVAPVASIGDPDGEAPEGSTTRQALDATQTKASVSAPPRRRWRWQVALAVVGGLVLAGGGAAAWLLRPQTDAHYLKALTAAHVAKDYPNDAAAIAHAKSFCRQLAAGHDDQGYASEKVAVQYYCKSALRGFKVIPTPAEQQATYLQALRDGGFGGTFPSDAAALAHAKSVCSALKAGGKQQGTQVDLTGVTTYCNEFASGFHVLEVADVDATFTLNDSSPSAYYPSIISSGGICLGYGGYSDISAGTEVLVTNGAGKVLAHTVLAGGKGDDTSCVFDFHVQLTEGEDDYAVTVSHRGEVHFTFEALNTTGIDVTLGS